jgi:hypothetical protein
MVRLHKVINRVYEGKVYYRWVLSISPADVKDLGWVDGQELEMAVEGSGLWVQPSLRAREGRRRGGSKSMEEALSRRNLARP